MLWLLLAITTALIVELFFYLPVRRHVQQLINSSRKAVRIVSSNSISDHWKEKALLHYARQIFLFSIYLLLLLPIIFLPVLFADYIASILDRDFIAFLMTAPGVISSVVVAFIYIYIRKKVLGA